MTTINDYHLHGELCAQNAGFSRWAFCEKGGHEYYIKEFLSPVYPENVEGLSEGLIERKRRLCDSFYAQKREFYDALMRCRTGNNVIVHDFFRSGSKFYAVTERVYTAGLDVESVSMLSREKKETLIKALLYSIAALHDQGIVHADLKPDNLLLKKTKDGFLTVKVIDFDGGFFVDRVPDDIQGDFVYLSPEVYLRMNDRPIEINEKIDVFALGLIIHQYWTGRLPSFDAKYKYAFQAALSDADITLSRDIPDSLREAIGCSLSRYERERPSVRELLACLGTPEPHVTFETRMPPMAEMPFFDDDDDDPLDHRHGFFVPDDLG